MFKNLDIHWMPNVLVEYDYIKGENHRITPRSITPSSPPLIKKLKITLNKDNASVDITYFLPLDIVTEIMDALIVDIVNSECQHDEYFESLIDNLNPGVTNE